MTFALWTPPTPNGWKVSILVEELIEAGHDLSHLEVHTVRLERGEQFGDAFTARNPNQKIPVLQDGDRCIPESCAILQYLAEKYPSDLLPAGGTRWDVLPWVWWQAANVGPVFGNKLSYTRYLDQVPDEARAHPLERFGNEARRLIAVLDTLLGDAPFVCGEQFTIADVALWPWVRGWKWSKVDVPSQPRVLAWIDRVRARPAVGRGIGWGAPPGEADRWSAETKAAYARRGASIAVPTNHAQEGDRS